MAGLGTTEIMFILMILFTVVPAIIVLGIVRQVNRNNQQAKANLKQCPFCAEMIQRQAKVCRFCSRDLAV